MSPSQANRGPKNWGRSRIVFAPLIRLDAYENLLKRVVEHERVANKISAIKRQHVSSLFFLPQGGSLDADHIAVLDDLHTIPLDHFRREPERAKLFTLNQLGFYLFVVKLSIHFCRFQEGEQRDGAPKIIGVPI